MTPEIKKAMEANSVTTRALHKAIAEAFPIGKTVSVVMQYGRPPIIGTITGHSGKEVCFKNNKTGIDRHFSATCESYNAYVI